MSHYIVCHQKRNNPRMDVRVCEKKCPLKEECKEYLSSRKAVVENQNATSVQELQAIHLEAA
ncbi:MAG: hypothetical protein JRI79_08950 [Deltaproteobacteria bacterium]|nr:hypothetical protein [Deltaproteobacteria bacterium]MBW2045191.1 hypothetical protein [Deltaproteobacteria bacterium]RLB33778.1 MAG: hypothetical protein DRH11_08035 [Deltaproteobacteria bacterium]